MFVQLSTLLAAVALDLALGEYPPVLHPVVWMGKLTDRMLDHAPDRNAVAQLVFGALLVALVTSIFAIPAWLLLDRLQEQSEPAAILAGVLIFKASFALRALWTAVEAVRRSLAAGDLPAARSAVAGIVSRDAAALPPHLVASAAIESAAESLTDSFVAPLCYFLLLGPAGAIGYRVVNTLDAMVGYHGRYEYLGKAAARLDDILNFVPARLAALLLAACAALPGGSMAGAWRSLWRDHARTESPNAGWTMAALAGALDVRLEKPGAYVLHDAGKTPESRHLAQAMAAVSGAAFLGLALAALALVMGHAG